MKIVVIGTSGGTGRHVTEQGTSRGHQIIAFTRRPDLVQGMKGLPAVVGGNASRDEDIREAIRGCDAAILTFGSLEVAQTVVRVLRQERVRRFVCVSPYPVRAKKPRLLVKFMWLLLGKYYKQMSKMEELVSSSGLDWTIVRPTRLSNGPPTRRVRVNIEGQDFARGPYKVTRADLASTFLDAVESDAYIGKAVSVS